MNQRNTILKEKNPNNLVIKLFGYLDISSSGYIAITSILVIAAIVLIIGTTTALVSISEAQISLSGIKNDQTLDLVEACTEEALLYINENNSLPTTLTLPQGTCTMTVTQPITATWIVTITASHDTYTKTVRITLTRSSTIAITRWEEL